MWDLPGPGLEPVSPALAGGFLTTVPPGKPCLLILNSLIQEQTVAMLQGHQDGKSLAMRDQIFAEAEWALSTCVTLFTDSFIVSAFV